MMPAIKKSDDRRTLLGEDIALKVNLAVGTLQWGTTPVDRAVINPKGIICESEARAIVSEFSSAGVTLWDTAEGYGGGTSEKRLGRLAQAPTSRKTKMKDGTDDMILMTKFLPVPWRYSHGCFERALRESCRRLRIECIPIYLLHSPVHWRPIEYWVESAALCKRKGLLRVFGLSNCDANQVRRAVDAGKKYGVDVVVNQVHYSLLDYNSPALNDMEKACHDVGVKIIAFSPIGQGLLTDTLTPQTWKTNRPAKMLRLQWKEILPLRNCLKELSNKYDKSMAQIALNWCMAHGTVPLVGCRSLKQARDSIGALGWTLTAEDVASLDAVALSKSTLESPSWRRVIFVSLFGIIMLLCRTLDYFGYGMVKEASV